MPGLPFSWVVRFQVRSYLRGTVWVWPVMGVVLAMISVRALHALEQALGLHSELDVDTARVVLGTLAASMFTFIVFVSSALLLAVQLASSQLTPRIIGFVFGDWQLKLALAVFVFTFTFLVSVLARINASVPLLTVRVSVYSCIVSVAVFLYLLDHVGSTLRASGAFRSIGDVGRRTIEVVYPRPIRPVDPSQDLRRERGDPPIQTIASRRAGAVLAMNISGLMAAAQRYDCVIEIVPQVGESVGQGDPLLRVHGSRRVPTTLLSGGLAIGPERTAEQDPTFAMRIIVDIACKALSPAINDPTTAVLALDELHHLLRLAASRDLDERTKSDGRGKVRLIFQTPGWSDFVSLAVTEIRHYGGESIQVTRRLRAMLENLIQTVPPARVDALQRELTLLQRSARRLFADPEDRELAEVSDPLGVGGRRQEPEQSLAAPQAAAHAGRAAPG